MQLTVLEALVILAAKYGPGVVVDIVALFKSKDVTLEAVEKAFANLKPYEAYGIPDKVPVAGTV